MYNVGFEFFLSRYTLHELLLPFDVILGMTTSISPPVLGWPLGTPMVATEVHIHF